MFEDYSKKVNIKVATKKVTQSNHPNSQLTTPAETIGVKMPSPYSIRQSRSRSSNYEKFSRLSLDQKRLIVNWKLESLTKEKEEMEINHHKSIDNFMVKILLFYF